MESGFLKFIIKKSAWWAHGSYKVLNQEGNVVFKSKSRILEFKKKIRMIPVDSDEPDVWIRAETSWMNKFIITRNNDILALMKKRIFQKNALIEIDSEQMGVLSVKANIWRTNFTFIKESLEIGRLSFKTWSTGEAGLVIKSEYLSQEILAITVAIAYLKETGQI